MAQHFSLSGTMGLFSRRHGTSRRGRAVELCFWIWCSITGRLCAMWLCQLERSSSAPSAKCFIACCQCSHPQLCSVSSIPLPFHCFISGSLSWHRSYERCALVWSLSFAPEILTFGSLCPSIEPWFIFLWFTREFNHLKVMFYKIGVLFCFFVFLEHHYECDMKMTALRLIQCQEHELNFYLRSKSENN